MTSSAATNGITAKTEGTLSAMNGKNLKLDGLSVSENTNSNQNTPVISTGDYQIYDVNISTVEMALLYLKAVAMVMVLA